VVFDPGEVKELQIQYQDVIDGTLLQSYVLDPGLTFNGKPNAARVNEFTVQVVLPPGIDSLLGANKDYIQEATQADGRMAYTWQQFDQYPTPLSVRWTVIEADLRLEKSATPQEITESNQEVEVQIVVENLGDTALEGLTLRDDYVPSDYEAAAEDEYLALQTYEASDPRLVWQVEIERLEPGESQTFHYRLRYIGDVSGPIHFNLKPCAALSEGVLVAVSNPVSMQKVGSPEAAPAAARSLATAWPLILLAFLAGLGVAMVVMAVVFARRRK
jgi:hypothetical protein